MRKHSFIVFLVALLAVWIALPVTGMAKKESAPVVEKALNVSLDTATVQMLQNRGLTKQQIIKLDQIVRESGRSAQDVADLWTATNNWTDVGQLLRMVREGLDWESLHTGLSHGLNTRDFLQAEKIAQKYGKPVAEVLHLKTSELSWDNVRNIVKDLSKPLTKLQQALGLDATVLLTCKARGFQEEEINTAAFLAKQTGKSLGTVLDLKKPQTSWLDVMKALGIADPVRMSRDYQQYKKANR